MYHAIIASSLQSFTKLKILLDNYYYVFASSYSSQELYWIRRAAMLEIGSWMLWTGAPILIMIAVRRVLGE